MANFVEGYLAGKIGEENGRRSAKAGADFAARLLGAHPPAPVEVPSKGFLSFALRTVVTLAVVLVAYSAAWRLVGLVLKPHYSAAWP